MVHISRITGLFASVVLFSAYTSVHSATAADDYQAICSSGVSKQLLNPESLVVPEFAEVGKDSPERFIEQVREDMKNTLMLAELSCLQQGIIDEQMKTLCIYSNTPTGFTEDADKITALENMLEDSEQKKYFLMRFQSLSKGGMTITNYAYCSVRGNKYEVVIVQ